MTKIKVNPEDMVQGIEFIGSTPDYNKFSVCSGKWVFTAKRERLNESDADDGK